MPAKKQPVFSSVTAPRSLGQDSPIGQQAFVAPATVSYSPLGSQYNGISANRFDDVAPTVAIENLSIHSGLKAKDLNSGRWTDEIRSASPRPMVTPDVPNNGSG